MYQYITIYMHMYHIYILIFICIYEHTYIDMLMLIVWPTHVTYVIASVWPAISFLVADARLHRMLRMLTEDAVAAAVGRIKASSDRCIPSAIRFPVATST